MLLGASCWQLVLCNALVTIKTGVCVLHLTSSPQGKLGVSVRRYMGRKFEAQTYCHRCTTAFSRMSLSYGGPKVCASACRVSMLTALHSPQCLPHRTVPQNPLPSCICMRQGRHELSRHTAYLLGERQYRSQHYSKNVAEPAISVLSNEDGSQVIQSMGLGAHLMRMLTAHSAMLMHG